MSDVDVVGAEFIVVGTVLDFSERLCGGNGDVVGVNLFSLSCDCSVKLVCFVLLWGCDMVWFVEEVDGDVVVLMFLFVGDWFDGIP